VEESRQKQADSRQGDVESSANVIGHSAKNGEDVPSGEDLQISPSTKPCGTSGTKIGRNSTDQGSPEDIAILHETSGSYRLAALVSKDYQAVLEGRRRLWNQAFETQRKLADLRRRKKKETDEEEKRTRNGEVTPSMGNGRRGWLEVFVPAGAAPAEDSQARSCCHRQVPMDAPTELMERARSSCVRSALATSSLGLTHQGPPGSA